MLRRIGLSNFKCWKELDIELAPITLLFGTNSSGKTAILQSLLMLKQTARGSIQGNISTLVVVSAIMWIWAAIGT